jgi:hypothetical protein
MTDHYVSLAANTFHAYNDMLVLHSKHGLFIVIAIISSQHYYIPLFLFTITAPTVTVLISLAIIQCLLCYQSLVLDGTISVGPQSKRTVRLGLKGRSKNTILRVTKLSYQPHLGHVVLYGLNHRLVL